MFCFVSLTMPGPMRQHVLMFGAFAGVVVSWTSKRAHAGMVFPTRTCSTHYDITGEHSKPMIKERRSIHAMAAREKFLKGWWIT